MVAMPMTMPVRVPSLAIIKLTARIPVGKDGAFVSAGWHGWLETE